MLLPVREFLEGEEGYLFADLALGFVLGDAFDHFIRKGLVPLAVLRAFGVLYGLEGCWILRYEPAGFLRAVIVMLPFKLLPGIFLDAPLPFLPFVLLARFAFRARLEACGNRHIAFDKADEKSGRINDRDT